MNFFLKVIINFYLIISILFFISIDNVSATQPKNKNFWECTAVIETWLNNIKEITDLCVFSEKEKLILNPNNYLAASIFSHGIKSYFEYIENHKASCSIYVKHNTDIEDMMKNHFDSFLTCIGFISEDMNKNTEKTLKSLHKYADKKIWKPFEISIKNKFPESKNIYRMINNSSVDIERCMSKYEKSYGPFAEISSNSEDLVEEYYNTNYDSDKKKIIFNKCIESIMDDIPDYKKIIESLENISKISNEIYIYLTTQKFRTP